MCGRFTLFPEDYAELARLTGTEADVALAEHYRQRYNTAPMQRSWIVRADRESRVLEYGRWGLVNFWAKDNKRAARQINARAETVHERPAYRTAFKSRRCLVPTSGFYEWSGPKGKRQPHWIHPVEDELWFFAGLFERWDGVDGEGETTFTSSARLALSERPICRPIRTSRFVGTRWLRSSWPTSVPAKSCSFPRIAAPDHIVLTRRRSSANAARA
jgi:putative SOS response-associated peptidase YedK